MNNNPEKNNDEKTRIQRLEQRVEELEEQLQAVWFIRNLVFTKSI